MTTPVYNVGHFTNGDDIRRYLASDVTEVRKSLSSMCRRLGPHLLADLYDIARNPNTPIHTRVSAINSILDRGYGRAPQSVEVNITEVKDIPSLTTRELTLLAHGFTIEGETDVEDVEEG